MKDKTSKSPIIKLGIIRKARAYGVGKTNCKLCLEEKLCISESSQLNKLLNKKTKLISKCSHLNKVSFVIYVLIKLEMLNNQYQGIYELFVYRIENLFLPSHMCM